VAEKTILVCDVCGQPATDTVAIVVGPRRLLKDYCGTHLAELMSGARAGKRGRPRATVVAAKAAPTTRRGARRAGAGRGVDVAAEARRLRGQGLSHRQIGDALMQRGITPPRAKTWNRVVIGRMLK